MTMKIICGFESGDLVEAFSTTGTLSVQGTTTRGAHSAYALRCNPTTSASGAFRLGARSTTTGQQLANALNIATFYCRFYIRIATLPSANNEEFFRADTTAGAVKFALRIGSDGKIAAYNNVNTLLVTGTTVLSTNTWYRIEVQGGTGAGATTLEWKVDGTTDVSTTASVGSVNYGVFYFGKVTNFNSKSVDYYFDDIAVDDAAYPGAGQCTALLATGAGTYQNFTRGGTDSGSNWGQVDERPHNSDTDYLLSTLNTSHAETEAMGDTGAAGITGTVNAVLGLGVVRADASSTGIQFRLRSGSTDSTLSSQFATSTTYVTFGAIHATDPATGSAWTLSGVDGIQVGAKEGSTTLKTRMTAVYAMVDYVPASSATATPDVGTVASTGVAPAGTATGAVTETPGAGASTSTGASPAATASGAVTQTPGAGLVTSTGISPSASGSGTLPATAGAGSVSLSGADSTASATGTAGATAAVASVNVAGAGLAASGTGASSALPASGGVSGGGADLTSSPAGAASVMAGAALSLSSADPVAGSGVGAVTAAPEGTAEIILTGTAPALFPLTLTVGINTGYAATLGLDPVAVPSGIASAPVGFAEVGGAAFSPVSQLGALTVGAGVAVVTVGAGDWIGLVYLGEVYGTLIVAPAVFGTLAVSPSSSAALRVSPATTGRLKVSPSVKASVVLRPIPAGALAP